MNVKIRDFNAAEGIDMVVVYLKTLTSDKNTNFMFFGKSFPERSPKMYFFHLAGALT